MSLTNTEIAKAGQPILAGLREPAWGGAPGLLERARHGSPVDTRNLPSQVLGTCHTLELAAQSPEEFWGQQFTVTCRVGAYHFEKCWGKLLAGGHSWVLCATRIGCWENYSQAVEKAVACRSPGQENWLQDMGNRPRKRLPPPESLQHPLLPQPHQSHRWNVYPAHLHYLSTDKEGWIWSWEAIT